MAKTVRFSELVRKSGPPTVATLWDDPKRNRAFQKAAKENRVLTVKQEPTGSKRDFGLAGFREEKNVSYFIFPKPLPELGETKVVGINYDLLDHPKVNDPFKPAPKKAGRSGPARAKNKRTAPVQSREKSFIATICRRAVWEANISIRARNKREAAARAEEAARALDFKMDEAILKYEIRDVREER